MLPFFIFLVLSGRAKKPEAGVKNSVTQDFSLYYLVLKCLISKTFSRVSLFPRQQNPSLSLQRTSNKEFCPPIKFTEILKLTSPQSLNFTKNCPLPRQRKVAVRTVKANSCDSATSKYQ